jgi:hypothetical protein
MTSVSSTSDERIVNNAKSSNAVRHNYRVLTDKEKEMMATVKSCGQEFLDIIEELRTPAEQIGASDDHDAFVVGTIDRELNIAVERIEEAVMWTVKHITA